MPSKKRHRDEDASTGTDHIHASRKRRLEYGQADANFAKIFNDLRDELPKVRGEATAQLLKALLSEASDQQSRIDDVVTRLIKGTCSGAKAARLGFSMALAEVLRLAFNRRIPVDGPAWSIGNLVQKILVLSVPEGKASGGEKRDYLLGRCFVLQAVLQSEILRSATDQDARTVLDVIADLASQKVWLRTECGVVLMRYLENDAGEQAVKAVVESWAAKGLLKSPEGVALWIEVKSRYPQLRLPKGYWHHNNPLAAQERASLTKLLLKNTVDSKDEADGISKISGARQSTPSFAWDVILTHLFKSGKASDFTSFWTDCVALPMFSPSSSTERKALGLQLVTLALRQAPSDSLEDAVHPNIIRCIIDQRANSDRLLFEASKQPLDQMTVRAKHDPVAASRLVCKVLTWIPGNVDKLTKSVLETMLGAADSEGLVEVIATGNELCLRPEINDQREADGKRRLIADLLLQVVRGRRNDSAALFANVEQVKAGGPKLREWLALLLQNLSVLAFGNTEASTSPPFLTSTQSIFQDRLLSVLGDLLVHPMHLAVLAPALVTRKLYSLREGLAADLNQEENKLIKKCMKLYQIGNDTKADESPTVHASQLLLSLGAIQVYKREPDSVGVLEDIVGYCQKGKRDANASANLVELLLSFVSRQSALYRKFAEQVFGAFAAEVSPEGMQSLIDVLSQKESLAGQQELFEQGGETREVVDVEEDEDVEEFSDVELMNGNLVDSDMESEATDASEEDDPASDSDNDSSQPTTSAENIDEDEEVERDLAKALGPAGLHDESETDGSDMDDDQMLEVDKALITVLTEHKKLANKKKDKKDAKENIVSFKNRVLDLLTIYVRSQYGNTTALDLIHPLTVLTRTTSSPPTAKKALDVLEHYFTACKKHKTIPQLEDAEGCFELLTVVHNEMSLGESKLHASACSKASLFLAKIVVSLHPGNWERVALMYVKLQKEWRMDPKSKIQVSIFNDWHSWCLAR